MCTFVRVSPYSITANLQVRFEEHGIVPRDKTLLADDYPETCTVFTLDDYDRSIPRYTHFRIAVPNIAVDEVNLTLRGANLSCGHNLYVTPLSAAETETWTGRWTKCPLVESSVGEGNETCSYQCKCTGSCEEIQIIKIPLTTEESYWTMCHICIIHTLKEDCSEAPNNCSGVYHVNLTTSDNEISRTDLYCDMVTDPGGWMVLVRRMDGSVNFTREWEDYKIGFGNLNGEFYAGHELVHRLTTTGRTHSLRVDLEGYDGQVLFAVYNRFSIGPETDSYIIHVTGYWSNSTAGNSLGYHDGMMFSTISRDNDRDPGNCSEHYNPWWHRNCYSCSLFAKYGPYPIRGTNKGLKWDTTWTVRKYARYAVMMIRPN
ncbi:hypothetical protein LSH36_32g05073 [Paralvinella palmiformis]|uniref:Fibrinogen C-terminal domain-containing protein n=1 Tax=Paralvinella palmiformis TaxID=53620 RepID=A0AAD9NG51_9ANNE|nr:hypothetical protein LSH36_32g05073 [Paralvinella palmiformis]